MISSTPVFLWRTHTAIYSRVSDGCLYCGSKINDVWKWGDVEAYDFGGMDRDMLDRLIRYFGDDGGIPNKQAMIDEVDMIDPFPVKQACVRCGWWKQGLKWGNCGSTSSSASALTALYTQDADLAIGQIRAHLKKSFSDTYSLDAPQLKDIFDSVYGGLGWTIRLVNHSKDGKVDLYCLSNSSGEICIVECRRNSETRNVEIDVLDLLIGTYIRVAADEAHLVVSNHFAKRVDNAFEYAVSRSIKLALVDAHELFQFLNLYSDKNFTLSDIRSIFGDIPARN